MAHSVATSIELAYTDPARICPMPAGASLIDISMWTVRLPQGNAVVRGPRRLLQRVASACDGMSSVAQIVEETRPLSLRAQVQGLIDDLLQSGVLVDASLYTVAAQKFAWSPSMYGNAADRAVWQQVPMRFMLEPDESNSENGAISKIATPLDALLNQRRSDHTFDDRPLTLDSLGSLLWLLTGVVGLTPGRASRRTIPSGGGVHALRPILVLRRAVGRWSPGVYSVRYRDIRQVELAAVSDDTSWLPRAVNHPDYLTFSTGMVFLVADPRLAAIKYRSRGLQYLFIEAGAALQNAALAAPALGVAMTVYGGYAEAIVSPAVHLSDHDLVVASAIIGTTPTATQREQSTTAARAEFEWVDCTQAQYRPACHVGRCAVEVAGVSTSSWGHDADPWEAYVKTSAECAERIAFHSPRQVDQGCFTDWSRVLDPRSLVRYSATQYRQPGFGLEPFNEQLPCGWVQGRCLLTGDRIRVLAEQVYSATALEHQLARARARYTEASSSGCAAHLDEARAIESALLELIERDAFMRSWLSQCPGTLLVLDTLPSSIRKRVSELEKMGCHVSLQWLPSPWAAVSVVYAQNEDLHFTVAAAAAKATLEGAVRAALDELETVAYARFLDLKPKRLEPRDVRAPSDHVLLYASARYFRRADALIQTQARSHFARAAKVASRARSASEAMREAGHSLVTVDIAGPESTLHQGRTALAVVRVLAPVLLPISFGHNRAPLGMVEHSDRRGWFPHPFP